MPAHRKLPAFLNRTHRNTPFPASSASPAQTISASRYFLGFRLGISLLLVAAIALIVGYRNNWFGKHPEPTSINAQQVAPKTNSPPSMQDPMRIKTVPIRSDQTAPKQLTSETPSSTGNRVIFPPTSAPPKVTKPEDEPRRVKTVPITK